MPSHLKTDEPLPVGVSLVDVKANDHADKQAGLIAERVRVPLHVSAPVIYYTHLTRRIQKRLATILINLPKRTRRQIAPKVKATSSKSLDYLIANSNHVAYYNDSRVVCARCRNSFHISDRSLTPFLEGPCGAIGHPVDKPVPLPYEAVHIGNQIAHHTHKLQIYRGIVYCRICGMRGPTKLHNLAHPCKPPTAYGKQVLSSLNQGRLPAGLSNWPLGQ